MPVRAGLRLSRSTLRAGSSLWRLPGSAPLQRTSGLANTAPSVATKPIAQLRKRFAVQGRSDTELRLDISGLKVLDDDSDERDGACQQHTDGLGDRPAHLHREVGGEQKVD